MTVADESDPIEPDGSEAAVTAPEDIEPDGTERVTVISAAETTTARFTPVFKLLLVTVALGAITSIVSGLGAWGAFDAARQAKDAAQDTAIVVRNIEESQSPEALSRRREEFDTLVASIGVTVDCNNEQRLAGLARSLERLLTLPAGAIFIRPCDRTPVTVPAPSSTTTTSLTRSGP